MSEKTHIHKNIKLPRQLYEELKQLAEQDRRNLQSYIIVALESHAKRANKGT